MKDVTELAMNSSPHDQLFVQALNACVESVLSVCRASWDQATLLLPNRTAPLDASLRSLFDGIFTTVKPAIEHLLECHQESVAAVHKRQVHSQQTYRLETEWRQHEIKSVHDSSLEKQRLSLISRFRLEQEVAERAAKEQLESVRRELNCHVVAAEAKLAIAETELSKEEARKIEMEAEVAGLQVSCKI